jgi:hypothetical protein
MLTQAALLLDPDEDAPLLAPLLVPLLVVTLPEAEPEAEPEPVEPLVEPEAMPLDVPLVVVLEPDMVPVLATTEPDVLPVVVPIAPLVAIVPEAVPELCPLGEAPLGPAVPELEDGVPEEVFELFCAVPVDELQAARTRHTRGRGLDFMWTMYHQICHAVAGSDTRPIFRAKREGSRPFSSPTSSCCA